MPVSMLCRLLGVACSTTYYQPHARHLDPQCDPVCVEAVRAVIQAHPTARAKTAERALEEALLQRFGTTRGAPAGLTLRHDNGLVFGARAYRALVRDYGLKLEYIPPSTPEQNGLCERFIRTFKEECTWQHRFDSLAAAKAVIARYIEHYNTQRTHSALKYNTPRHTYLTLCNTPHQQAA